MHNIVHRLQSQELFLNIMEGNELQCALCNGKQRSYCIHIYGRLQVTIDVVQWRTKIIEPVYTLLDANLLYTSLDVLHPVLASLATPLLHAPPYANRAKTDSVGSVVP